MRSFLPLLFLTACGPGDEDDATLCSDRADNDKDGLVDCMEPACAAYCRPTTTQAAPTPVPSSPTRDTATGTPAPTTKVDTSTDTGAPLVALTGHVQLVDAWDPSGFTVELVGAGVPPTTTDSGGRWRLDVPAGTYPWRLTAPGHIPVPTTGTELTVAFPASTTVDTAILGNQAFDVVLPSFVGDIPLPLTGNQVTTGLELTVDDLSPVGGEEDVDAIGAVLAGSPLPIEDVDQVHLMYYLRPFGHTGTIRVQLIYRYDPDLELWGLDPLSGRWQSFGGFVDVGNNRILATQTVPWVTTLAVVTP